MKIDNWLNETIKALMDYSETPRLDAEVLLCNVLKKDRAWVIAHPEYKLQSRRLSELTSLIKRRQKSEPIAYILGKCEFYGREFLVDKNVLVPRPESETMIDMLKQVVGERIAENEHRIIDVGTGSGALAVTSKLEIPCAKVLAIDIDSKCLSIAKKNAKKHKVHIEFLQSDLISNLPTTNYKLTTILANLPYVPIDYQINEPAKHEPRLALFGGNDGLDLYRRLFDQIHKFLVGNLPLIAITESLDFQHKELAKIAESAGFKQIDEQDLIQVFEPLKTTN